MGVLASTKKKKKKKKRLCLEQKYGNIKKKSEKYQFYKYERRHCSTRTYRNVGVSNEFLQHVFVTERMLHPCDIVHLSYRINGPFYLIKKIDICRTSAGTCGNLIEQPQWGSNEYPQCMFWGRPVYDRLLNNVFLASACWKFHVCRAR